MALEEHRSQSPSSLGFAVITISDTRSGAEDKGGAYLVARLQAAGHSIAARETVRDERDAIQGVVRRCAAIESVDLVLTTGGTGIAPRDVTFDSLRAIFDSEIPGFGELFRWLSFREIGAATLLSRAIGGLIGGKVVLALPGSPKALALALDEIVLKEAGHLVSQTRAAKS
jgi:molybdenum cofactor biosynthesis protein B